MREDIQIDINTGDVLIQNVNNKAFYDFNWVERPDGELTGFMYGEVTLPRFIDIEGATTDGINVQIPYTPVCKFMKIKIKQYTDAVNIADRTEWLDVKAGAYGGEIKKINTSELITIADDDYCLRIEGDYIRVYSAGYSDFVIDKANQQNQSLLVHCVPGNSRRYPTSGVGLIRWVNANSDLQGLSERLMSEFEADGVSVVDAYFDEDNNQLFINMDTSGVDGET
jgi:hypothetical protein